MSDKSLTLSARQTADFELLANGGFAPLTGFQGSEDWKSRRREHDARRRRGVWPIPITLATDLECREWRRRRAQRRQRQDARPDPRQRDLRARRRAGGRARLPARPTTPTPASPRSTQEGNRCIAGAIEVDDTARPRGGVHAPLLHPGASRARSSPTAAGSGSSPSRPATRSTAPTST